MLADSIEETILDVLGFTPTEDQRKAISVFSQFITDMNSDVAMIMRGSAGTGKTTLAAAIVRALQSMGMYIVLLAPTGRAAKVFSLYAGHKASTIHRHIYRQKELSVDVSSFKLGYNALQDTLFIVDEASMISYGGSYGSGSLLDDLMAFVYGGKHCRLMLIGDHAQLPPVGESESPALSKDIIEGYGMTVYEAELDEVLRQGSRSGILQNATGIRRGVIDSPYKAKFFTDVVRVMGDELIDSLSSSYSDCGMDETIIITRSNKRANIYNRGVRGVVLGYEEEVCSGDMLMIVKNKYIDTMEEGELDFIANGDRAKVLRVRNVHNEHGFRFAEMILQFPDYDEYELTTMVILDTLTSEAPAITNEQSTALYEKVLADYADIPRKADRLKAVKTDRYYGALQIKFAYAVTCHKAQGGQWAHVYVDQGYITEDMMNEDYFRWLYTAFTRAKEKLFLVNWPVKEG